MVILLQECGMRLNELCSLSFDCLDQDANENWVLHYRSLKRKEACKIPVSNEVATIIIEQQKALQNKQSEVPNFLFPNSNGQPFSEKTFLNALNRMAYEKNIRNDTGEVWRFQAHQFRYTFAIRLFNNDVPLEVIHYFLGHKSRELTMAYNYTQQQKLNVEMNSFIERYYGQFDG
jgi:integrase/recombinase XerD